MSAGERLWFLRREREQLAALRLELLFEAFSIAALIAAAGEIGR